MLEKDIKKVLISHDEIVAAAKQLGAQLTEDYHGKNPILVGVLKGSVPFMAELIKHIDTGKTLKSLCEMFKDRNAASVKIATLLDKPEGRLVEIEADYTCFTIPNEFVVGYGLDYVENYRNLPYVGILKEEVYTK